MSEMLGGHGHDAGDRPKQGCRDPDLPLCPAVRIVFLETWPRRGVDSSQFLTKSAFFSQKNLLFFWKILKNTPTPGDYLEFAAIPRKICENFDEK